MGKGQPYLLLTEHQFLALRTNASRKASGSFITYLQNAALFGREAVPSCVKRGDKNYGYSYELLYKDCNIGQGATFKGLFNKCAKQDFSKDLPCF